MLMQLRLSGRLSFTQAMPPATVTATVSASARSAMAIPLDSRYIAIGYSDIIAMVNSVMEMRLPHDHAHDPLTRFPGYALRRAASAMMAELGARLARVDLRISDASVLFLVADRDDLTSTEIGKILDIQRANMVPLLSRLEEAGLIARLPIDRKSQAIVLTDEGRNRLDRVNAITAAFEADLLARVPAEHRPHLLPALLALWE